MSDDVLPPLSVADLFVVAPYITAGIAVPSGPCWRRIDSLTPAVPCWGTLVHFGQKLLFEDLKEGLPNAPRMFNSESEALGWLAVQVNMNVPLAKRYRDALETQRAEEAAREAARLAANKPLEPVRTGGEEGMAPLA